MKLRTTYAIRCLARSIAEPYLHVKVMNVSVTVGQIASRLSQEDRVHYIVTEIMLPEMLTRE
jgi:hypothetical protein